MSASRGSRSAGPANLVTSLIRSITSAATHYRIPCLLIVCNNRSFYNDEAHQERVARMRGRPVENKWIGQRINEPDIDLAMLAVAQGAKGIGPVTAPEQLRSAIAQGVRAVMDGEVCVIDARVRPGYDAEISGERAARQEPVGMTLFCSRPSTRSTRRT